MPRLSVIICAHNPRAAFMRRVLEALRAQSLPKEQWELLLIDNGSQPPLAGQTDLAWHPQARLVREEELGLTPARLRGIREAAAEILVFVDDDNILAADYLETALQIGEEWPFVGTWGGSILPEYEVPVPDWVGDQLWRVSVAEVKQDVWSNLREGFSTIPAGAGMCVRRRVGLGFIQWCQSHQGQKVMDRTGATLTGYGDVDLAHCALDLGLGNGKSTRLRLTHLIPASRLTLDYFLRHAEGDATSLQILRAIRGLPVEPPERPSLLGSLRWFVHRRLHRVPREQYEIAKAHQRGLEKGWEIAQRHLKATATSPNPNP